MDIRRNNMTLINGIIHTVSGMGTIGKGFVKITGGKISEVNSMDNFICDDAQEIIDLNGMNVTPGFIDAHTHLGVCEEGISFEGDDSNEETDPCTPQLRIIDGINPMEGSFREALESGVTCVLSAPGSANAVGGQIAAIKTYGKRIDNMIVKAPAAIKFALGENPKTVYSGKNQMPSTRTATAAVIREILFKAKEYMQNIEKYEEGDADSLPDFDIKLDSLVPLLKGEISAHFHAHRADDIFTAVRIAKEFDLDCVIVHATEGHLIADELLKDNIPLIVGPVISEKTKPELKNLTPKSIRLLSNAGILTAICTDHPVIPLRYLTLSVALAAKDGLDEEKALEAITINPARICHIDDRVGSIETGKDADLVILDGSPFDYRCRILQVIAGGKRVFD